MLGTNGELKALVGSIDREMRQHEWEVRWGNRLNSAVVTRLGELRDIRRLLVRVLANRKAEASKRVVDFGQWLNGRGALH
jgi:hypothetical protein